jgi:hypothetical protein
VLIRVRAFRFLRRYAFLVGLGYTGFLIVTDAVRFLAG